jgi:quercetin dioxygenase-like cupin family protein
MESFMKLNTKGLSIFVGCLLSCSASIVLAANTSVGVSVEMISNGNLVNETAGTLSKGDNIQSGIVTFKSGGHTNWHYHSGSETATILAGTLKIYTAKTEIINGVPTPVGPCTTRILKSGDVVTFPPSVVHLGMNATAADVKIFVLRTTSVGKPIVAPAAQPTGSSCPKI